jgi:DNA-binding transcriptional LysR family regulator
VQAGVGAALLPSTVVADDLQAGRLVSWGEASDRNVELWVLHTSRRLVSSKVSAFVTYLCEAFADVAD